MTTPTHFEEDCKPFALAEYRSLKPGHRKYVEVRQDDEVQLYYNFAEAPMLNEGGLVLYAFAGDICCSLAHEFAQEGLCKT